MQKDAAQKYGQYLNEQSDRTFSRALLFSLLLIVAHIIKIEPGWVKGVGLDVNFRNAAVIYGLLGAIVIHYLSLSFLNMSRGVTFFNPERTSVGTRYRLAEAYKAQKGKRDPLAAKKRVKVSDNLTAVLMIPWFIGVALIVVGGLFLAIVDVGIFLLWLFEHPPKEIFYFP